MRSKDTMPAAAYYRMSTDEQSGSVEEQRRRVQAYATENGYRVVAEYADHGVSASKDITRPNFERLFQEAPAGAWSHLIVYDLDRFSRKDAVETLSYLHRLRQAGVTLVTLADGPIDLSDGARMAWLVAGIKATGNREFSVKLSNRCVEAKQTAARAGKGGWGKIPYGYDRLILDARGEVVRRGRFGERCRRDSKAGEWAKLVPSDDPRKVEAVRFIFGTYAESGLGVRELTLQLNDRGFPTAVGKPWWPSMVRRILRNPVYVGDAVYGRYPNGVFTRTPEVIVNANAHEPLIDRATWDAVQRRLEDQKKRTSSWKGENKNCFLLTRIIVCGRCGRFMEGTRMAPDDGRVPFYRCRTRSTRHQRCGYNAVKQEPLVRHVVATLREAVMGGGYDALLERVRARLLEKHRADPAQRAALRSRIEDLDGQCKRLSKRLATAPDEVYADLERELAELRRQHQRASAELLELDRVAPPVDVEAEARKIAARLTLLESELDSADPIKLRELLRRMVYRIVVHHDEVKQGKRTLYKFREGVIELRPDAILLPLGQNVLMIGSPGSGKTMLARRLPTILPPLAPAERLETTRIYSSVGRLPPGEALLTTRPFRSPHHTISDAGMVGGGTVPSPGEISLAHHGVLFLDELPEFNRRSFEVLRQPLEEGRVTISRALHSTTFPASFVLVASMNPCPCG